MAAPAPTATTPAATPARKKEKAKPLTDMWMGEDRDAPSERVYPYALTSVRWYTFGLQATICICTVYNLASTLAQTLDWDVAAVDMFPLGMVTLVGLMCELGVKDHPSYRQASSQGLLIGMLTVPAVLSGLMLREMGDVTLVRFQALAWYLRVAVCASGLAAGNGVVGWATGRKSYGKFLLFVMLLSYLCRSRITAVPLWASLLTLLFADALNRALLFGCVRSFTLGEGTIISTALALLSVDTVAQVAGAITETPNVLSRELLPVDCVVQCLVVGTLFTCLALWPWVASQQQLGKRAVDVEFGVQILSKKDMSKSKKDDGDTPAPQGKGKGKAAEGGKDAGKEAAAAVTGGKAASGGGGGRAFLFALALAAVVGFVCVPAATLLVKEFLPAWVLAHVMASDERLRLVAYWCLVLLCTLAVYPPKGSSVPRIILRKGYHVIAIALFGPGQMFEPETMRLAYAAAFALLVTLEIARAARIGGASGAIHRAMAPLLDERDRGTLVLTHIYLLVGCAAPSLLCTLGEWGGQGPALLLPFAGLLIVGAGDTTASVMGTYLGRTPWVHSQKKGKTMEGTLAGWVCTAAAATAFMHFGAGETDQKAFAYVGIATASACLLEAFTQQIDNLVLPLWYFTMLLLAAAHTGVAPAATVNASTSM